MSEPNIQVMAQADSHKAVLRFHGRTAPCALGPRVSDVKTEGDGATPLGIFALRRLYYRPDRWTPPETVLPVSEITQNCGWSDDVQDHNYNRYVRLPHDFSHEELWRPDGLYDAFVSLGYNDEPIIAGRGSAIFLHLQKNNFQPTRGCVAIDKEMMHFVLTHATPQTKIEITKQA
jgi:L,D-peptidoglycan transpeptidase YkuD (ErfK/YbiS/YcfS/YnhG family)